MAHGTYSTEPPGEYLYGPSGASSQTHTFVPGNGVTSISVCCISAGNPGSYSNRPAGCLAWASNYTVVPGQSYTVVVGGQGSAGSSTNPQRVGSYFVSTSEVYAQTAPAGNEAQYTVSPNAGTTRGGGTGGKMGPGGGGYQGGGGAGGYTSYGGRGGGSGGQGFGSNGGSVGIVVKGTTGSGGGNGQPAGPGGGGGGGGGGHQSQGVGQPGSGGGYGHGGSMFGSVGNGAVRIIWPGDTRTYPDNST